MAKQAAAVYERIAQPWLHRAKRHIAAIENAGELEGETTPGAETAAARKALGIATHQEIMRLAAMRPSRAATRTSFASSTAPWKACR